MSDQDDLSVEERAENLGWKAEEDWKGDPPAGGFKSAEDFLESGEKHLRMSNADNEKLHDEIHSLKESIARQSESVGALKSMYEQKAVDERKRGYQAAYDKLTAEQSQAIQDQDADAFTRSRSKERQLEEQQRKEDAATKETASSNDLNQVREEFIKDNQWFSNDFQLHRDAKDVFEFITKNNPNIQPKDALKQMREEVIRLHPDHEAFQGREAPSMDGGGNRAGGGNRNNDAPKWQDLPQEDKSTFSRFVEDGLFTDDAKGRKEYLELRG